LASPRTGLAPAGCRELVARLRHGVVSFLTAPELLDAHRLNWPTLGPFDQYESLIARDLPFLWLPQGASLVAIAKDLAGPGRVSAFGNIAPNRWYFTRSS